MTPSHNLRHRHAGALAAAQLNRREPAPQGAIFTFDDPRFPDFTSIFQRPGLGFGRGGNDPTTTPEDTPTPTPEPTTTSTSILIAPTTTAAPTTRPPTAATQISFTTLMPPTTTTTTTPSPTFTPAPSTVIPFTPVASTTSPLAASTSSAVPTPDTSTGMSTGVVIGGISAGVAAIAALGFAAAFFVRRARKRSNGITPFDAPNFRRSAALLKDPPTHEDTVARGFNPPMPPPKMTENRHGSPAPTFGTQYGAPGPQPEYGSEYTENHAGYGSQWASFAPGQVVNMHQGQPPMPAYAQNPFAAEPSPIFPSGEYYQQQQYESGSPNVYGQPAAVVGGALYPVLTRQGSNGSGSHRTPPHEPVELHRESVPDNDYIDLNRSSVSPYQAAQYVEISRRLNTSIPVPEERDLPPIPPAKHDPFTDPSSVPPSPGAQYVVHHSTRPLSGDSMNSQTLEFPVPPSPAHTTSSRYRVDSTPPTLPEIQVQSRVSYAAFDAASNTGIAGSPLGSGFPSGLPTPGGTRFPVSPSPLASSFGMPTPQENTFESAGSAPSMPPPAVIIDQQNSPQEQKRGKTVSMYDAEDAYGGF